jgi:Lar family restriction alleviation protein
MNEKLKPCPFCGGEAEFVRGNRKINGCYTDVVKVVCKSCQSSSERVIYNKKKQGGTGEYSEAAALWNRRTPDIVRCGECDKLMTFDCMLCSFDNEGFCTGGPDDDQFCSFGQRRVSS